MNNKNNRPILKIVSWSLYDLSNQFFVLNIITLYFSRWLVIENKVPELFYSVAFGISVFFVAVLSPILGYISDVSRKHKYFLARFTIVSVVFTFILGFVNNIFLALFVFIIANFGCQMSVVFYNALLVKVAPSNKIGLISGLGRTFGYLGAVLALYIVNPILLPFGYQSIFVVTSILFFCFSLPCLIFIKDENSNQSLAPFFKKENLKETYNKIKSALINTYKIPGVKEFLKSAFYGLSAVNIIILFMAVYVSKVFNLQEEHITNLIAVGTIFAIIGSLSSGVISDYLGYKLSLSIVFFAWIVCFLFGGFAKSSTYYYLVGCLSGFALGSTFVVSRAVAIKLVPKNKLGELFGLFNLVAYIASIAGPLYWGVMRLLLSGLGVVSYRITLLSLNIFMLLGIYYLSKISIIRNNY